MTKKQKQPWRKEFLAEIRRMNRFIRKLKSFTEGEPIHYNKGGDEVRKAYVKWRTTHKYATHNVISFVAGFNAARA